MPPVGGYKSLFVVIEYAGVTTFALTTGEKCVHILVNPRGVLTIGDVISAHLLPIKIVNEQARHH